METMSYPCSPLLSFPAPEECIYSLWSPQASLHENATIHVDHPTDHQEHHEFLDPMPLDCAKDFSRHQGTTDVGVFIDFDERVLGQENGNLVVIQEELMEENSLTDLLLTGAEAVEAGDSRLASVVFSRLDDLLLGIPDNATASSFDRLAYHFDQGLQSRISCAFTRCCYPPLVQPPPSDHMSVHQIIQELSPFVKFAHFTANQAILEATNGDADVHIVDLNIGASIQWPSLMSDLARHGGRSFHLTAVTTIDADHDNNDTHHTAARRLSEFAESMNLPFQYDFLCVRSEEDLHGLSKNFQGSVVISCDTTSVSYRLLRKLQALLLSCVRNLQPKLMVILEEELVRIGKEEVSVCRASFVDFFVEALHHFTTVFESLASCFGGGNHGVCLRLVEREMLGPRVQDFIEQYGSVTIDAHAPGLWNGLGACELSSCNIAQARMLVGLFSRGFGVMYEKGRLVLCWKSRPLTSVCLCGLLFRKKLVHDVIFVALCYCEDLR